MSQPSDANSGAFLEPIPRWITFWGFLFTVGIFIFLLSVASGIEYAHEISIEISFEQGGDIYALLDADSYAKVSANTKVEISIPTMTEKLYGTLMISDPELTDQSVRLSVALEEQDQNKIPNHEQFKCQGKIRLGEKTLLEQVLENIF